MPVATRWKWFHSFRRLVLSLASIICLVWSILIAVYLVRNWSGYESGQRGLFAGLVALDLVSSILIYLMIVVQYRYWPDAARTLVLIGLHAAGASAVVVLKPHLPCNAFGGWTVCNRLTITVIVGSWIITGLLTAYGLCLPFMAGSRVGPPSMTEANLENNPGREVVEGKPEEERLVEEEKPSGSPPTRHSRAWLLQNQGISPDMSPVGLPRLSGPSRSPTSSSLSSVSPFAQPWSRLPQGRGDPAAADDLEAAYRTSSQPSQRSSVAQTIRVPSTSRTDSWPISSGAWLGPALPQSSLSPTLHPSGDYFVEDSPALLRQSNSASIMNDRSSTLSFYSQPSAAPSRSGTTRGPVSRQVSTKDGQYSAHHPSTPLREDMDQAEMDSLRGVYPDTLLPALPIPSYITEPGAARTALELHHSRPPSTDVGEFLSTVGGRPRAPRTDSIISNVDMDEWRKLVLGAAGKA